MINAIVSGLDKNSLVFAISKNLGFEKSSDDIKGKNLILNNSHGTGSVEHLTFKNQFEVINLNLKLKQDLVFKIPNKKPSELYFIYTVEGIAYYSISSSEKYSKIKELKPTSLPSNHDRNGELIIAKDQKFSCNIIVMDYNNYFENFHFNPYSDNTAFESLNELFLKCKKELIESSSSLKIAGELRLIKEALEEHSITYNLQLLNKYQTILSIYIQNFYDIVFNTKEDLGISTTDIQRIRKITNYITANPGLNHSQEQLCSKFFVSQSKLQTGFKAVHKTTVSNFTRNVRLEKSEKLLSTTDLNVSEIVYTVGFTSRSYFSKIFKLKYGCNPTAYRSQFCKSNGVLEIIN